MVGKILKLSSKKTINFIKETFESLLFGTEATKSLTHKHSTLVTRNTVEA